MGEAQKSARGTGMRAVLIVADRSASIELHQNSMLGSG
jgi:hypothetical protein